MTIPGLDDLKKSEAFIHVQIHEPEIIYYQEIVRCHFIGIVIRPAFVSGLFALLKEAIGPDILDRPELVERCDAQCIGDVCLPGSRTTCNKQVFRFIDPVAFLEQFNGMCVQQSVRTLVPVTMNNL